MVRITSGEQGGKWVVCVQGRLTEGDVAVLHETCRAAPARFDLDLSDLRGMDERGVAALRALSTRARVIGASPYVRLRLRGPIAN